MKAHWQRKSPGQSIPLVALMLLILFAMVGLSVDVGNTYAEQRNVVRATDAAALSGMQVMIKNKGAGNGTSVWPAIKVSLKSNGIVVAGDDGVPADARNTRVVQARYLRDDGTPSDCPDVASCGSVPDDVAYIELKVSGLVDTYFARLVGQKTLPVGTTAYGAQCQPKDNVFPLAISNVIAEDGMYSAINDDTTSSDYWKQQGKYIPTGYSGAKVYGNYTGDTDFAFGFTWRRLFTSTNPNASVQPFQFKLLSWSPGKYNDQNELKTAFLGKGTLAQGYQEADQPETPPDGAKIDPSIYPLKKTQIDATDWVQGANPSAATLNEVANALNNHAANHDTLILPLVSPEAVGDASDGTQAFHIQRLGIFRVANSGAVINGSEMQVDLAYLGEAQKTACLTKNIQTTVPPAVTPTPCPPGDPCNPPPPTETPPPAPSFGIKGKVFVKPAAKSSDTKRDPISYQIVLDLSGSMSADMKGFVNNTGTKKLCMWNANSVDGLQFDTDCYPGKGSENGVNFEWWNNQNERRVYLAKQAVNQTIDSLDPTYGDVMRVIAFGEGIGSSNTQVLPASGWSNDKTLLKSLVKSAGSVGDYYTKGATPTAQGLNQTLQLLQSSSAPKEFNGNKYQKVVILITDGMPNVFLNGTRNDAQDICGSVQLAERYSKSTCQSLYSSYYGSARPIDLVIAQATSIKNLDSNLLLYVVAVSDFPANGLSEVANNPNMVIRADAPDEVSGALEAIVGSVTSTSPCTTAPASALVNTIDGTTQASFPNQSNPPEYGYVYLKDENGNPLPAPQDKIPIVVSPDTNGKLGWYLAPENGLLPGKYRLTAAVGYKSPIDGEARLYNTIYDNAQTTTLPEITIQVDRPLGNMAQAPDITLVLDPSVQICPTLLP